MVKPMVHSIKHVVQFTLASVAFGVAAAKTIAIAVAAPDRNLSTEVLEGSTVKAVYLELWQQSDDATTSSAVNIVEKRPGGHAAATAAEMAALFSYDNKKNVLETHQGLVPSNLQNPVNVYRHWIKIPKGKQRQGLGDIISTSLLAQSDGLNFCGMAVFKEYY